VIILKILKQKFNVPKNRTKNHYGPKKSIFMAGYLMCKISFIRAFIYKFLFVSHCPLDL